jgi:hypothetical protein
MSGQLKLRQGGSKGLEKQAAVVLTHGIERFSAKSEVVSSETPKEFETLAPFWRGSEYLREAIR